jgi:predicted nucleic acid-binding protein
VNRFVIDTSVVMAWAFEDESAPYADQVLDSLAQSIAIVPPIWPAEVANVLVTAERRRRLPPGQGLRFLALLRNLPIEVAASADLAAAEQMLAVAHEFTLSAYDAAYLALSLSGGFPLATQDDALRKAARKAHIPLWLK